MLMMGFIGLWALGLGAGLVFGSIISVDDGIERVLGPIFRIMYFTSGVFFTIDDVPARLRDLLLLNPILHLIEFVRSGFFGNFDSTAASVDYVGGWIMGTLALGLISHWLLRRRIDLT